MSTVRIVVTVSGGNINGMFTDDPNMEVYVVDYDNLRADRKQDFDAPITPGSLQTYRSVIENEIKSYACLAKLAAKIAE